ncbi:MAG TPA: DNA-directed RNA polymerase subunit beta, partial [Spirochaetia bacterium]|nr:DNA-directed RNA polymerase subunit beta [Spirochaetia bacterium]
MAYTENKIKRSYIGKDYEEAIELPDLIGIQLSSYERFLQRERMLAGDKPLPAGLEEVFQATFPIESPNGDMLLSYEAYSLDESAMKYSEMECKQKGLTYAVPLKARINLIFQKTGEIRQKEIYLGDIPLMTDRGTFIINGAERVVVSQIHRSPGVIFCHEKGVYSARIIPYRGSWLEFEIDQKKELIYAKIDRKKRILGTMFLRALGFETREDILSAFYGSRKIPLSESREDREGAVNKVLARSVWAEGSEGEKQKLYRAGDKLHLHEVDELVARGIKEVEVIDFQAEDSLHFDMILNCLEREDIKLVKEDPTQDEPTKADALAAVYATLLPGEPITVENAERDLHSMFFTTRRYDLGKVGRYKLNKKFDYDIPIQDFTLAKADIIATMKYLMSVYYGESNIDDIDHLGNRRVRSVGELLANVMKSAFSRMERIAKERMSLKETDTIRPQDLV